MDIVLIPGMWLTGSVWEPVVDRLAQLGHRATALTLPGQGDGDPGATLADQVAAVVAAVDSAPEGAVVVGHSAAASLAWIAADQRPETVRAIVLIGGFPASDGAPYFAAFDPADGLVPFPDWGPFEGPDSADLDAEQRAAFVSAAVAVPEAVTHAPVRLRDPRRHAIPVTLICPEFTPEDVRGWIASGDLSGELLDASSLTLVDFDSGHWPMITRPAELAATLAEIADHA
jgi:pimeloyl-ACP methyl ester carboxylesterase